MALLKLFPIITDDSNKNFIPFDDFFRFLKHNDQKARRIDNVRQILKCYKDGIKTVGDQTCVPVISVIRYIFAYSESSDGCLQAAKDIDVDAVYTHMFVVSKYWPRNSNGSFKNQVFVILQKPRSMIDIYNVTKMLEVFEQSFADRDIGMKLAVSICMAWNDFIPSCHEISHDTILKHFVRDEYRKNLFIFKDEKIKISQPCFIDFYKTLYCPKRYNPSNYTFNDVQALTIAKNKDEMQQSGFRTNDPRKWLPPETALSCLCDLVQLQVLYLETAGHHSAFLPAFLGTSCLQKNSSGEIEYNFGPDAHFKTFKDLPDHNLIKRSTSKKEKKRQPKSTPQRGARRKRPLT